MTAASPSALRELFPGQTFLAGLLILKLLLEIIDDIVARRTIQLFTSDFVGFGFFD